MGKIIIHIQPCVSETLHLVILAESVGSVLLYASDDYGIDISVNVRRVATGRSSTRMYFLYFLNAKPIVVLVVATRS